MVLKRIKLFKLFDFEVKIDPSWFIIAALVTWSLSSGLFPQYYKDLQKSTYWIMGILGALFLFLSVVYHELCHSLVARKFGLPMKGITLFMFGGIAEMEEEPPSAKAEFFMAIAGPLSSIILGAVFFIFLVLGRKLGWSTPVTGVLSYLRWINWALAGFNLLPAFPLDGGRVLRSIIWTKNKNLVKATKIASKIGSGFGVVFVILGILYIFMGAFVGGLWWLLIGMFLNNASKMSYQQVIMRQAVEGRTVENFMNDNPVTVSPDLSIKDFIEDYVYKFHFKMFPVVKDGKLKGCISTKQIKEVEREKWNSYKIKDVLWECSSDNTVSTDTDASKLLNKMRNTSTSRFMVVDNGKLVGVVVLKDLLDYMSLKQDLEGT